MAELFQRNKSTISRHISKIYEEGELSPMGTVAKFATVQMYTDIATDHEYSSANTAHKKCEKALMKLKGKRQISLQKSLS